MSGLASVIADGYHSLLDASSNLVGLVGIESQPLLLMTIIPMDIEIEIFSSIGIALLLFVAAYNIVGEAMERWQSARCMKRLHGDTLCLA